MINAKNVGINHFFAVVPFLSAIQELRQLLIYLWCNPFMPDNKQFMGTRKRYRESIKGHIRRVT